MLSIYVLFAAIQIMIIVTRTLGNKTSKWDGWLMGELILVPGLTVLCGLAGEWLARHLLGIPTGWGAVVVMFLAISVWSWFSFSQVWNDADQGYESGLKEGRIIQRKALDDTFQKGVNQGHKAGWNSAVQAMESQQAQSRNSGSQAGRHRREH